MTTCEIGQLKYLYIKTIEFRVLEPVAVWAQAKYCYITRLETHISSPHFSSFFSFFSACVRKYFGINWHWLFPPIVDFLEAFTIQLNKYIAFDVHIYKRYVCMRCDVMWYKVCNQIVSGAKRKLCLLASFHDQDNSIIWLKLMLYLFRMIDYWMKHHTHYVN